jgi:hypothetical protein
MGKEIRAGLSVVGILLLSFCILLFARLSRHSAGPPDVSIDPSAASAAAPPLRPRDSRPPTIVKGGGPESLVPGHLGPDTYEHQGPVSPRQNPRWESRQPVNSGDFVPGLNLPRLESPAEAQHPRESGELSAEQVTAPRAVRMTVRAGDNLSLLAERTYGSRALDRALWQWLNDQGLLAQLQAGSIVDVPTAEHLEQLYRQLVPPAADQSP